VTDLAFQRARKPEQIGLRREAILRAAAELFDEAGPDGAGLNAIAARAGFTKSNVYRYFESREAVLLSLFLDEFGDFTAAVEQALVLLPVGDIEAVASVCAGAFVERPRLCALLGILAGVIERNVSEAGVLELKSAMLEMSGRIAGALSRALPDLSIEECGWVAGVTGTFVSGLWPAANPNPVVTGVMARPEFALMKLSTERDLERMLLTLLRGMLR